MGIEAAYTYDYTLKSARLQYSDNSELENAVSIAAQFADGVLKATADRLKPATTYFYRFELDNGITRMWTEIGTFRTLDKPIVTELVVTTAEVSGIADTCAVCGGEVVSEGSSEVIARGVCYGLSENPSLDDCTGKTVDGGGLGAFTSTMTGLEKGDEILREGIRDGQRHDMLRRAEDVHHTRADCLRTSDRHHQYCW